ncbi:uncharacterized protein V1516DRAFT_666670 [Lipomyces oligophaga]|uniref:uncharacterized protein n=1 Tax=Lipomyces oligophaga TaxID=45792 RepID=UPI0034CE9833
MSTKFNPLVQSFQPYSTNGSSKLNGLVSSGPPTSSPVAIPNRDQSSETTANSNTLKTINNHAGSVGRKGIGSASLAASPRNNQSQRSNHKNSRKSPGRNRKPMVNADDISPEHDAALIEQFYGSRRRRNQVSVSHLLNFSLTPRENNRPRHHAPSWQRSNSYVMDKSQFVNANYRFVVHPSGDYTSQSLDPDVVIPWHLILQIIVSKQTQHSSCPICLTDDPVASRMVRCGHIFCLPCLMRMLESEMPVTSHGHEAHNTPKKRNICPLCLDSVSLSDAKPVKWVDHPGDASAVPIEGQDVLLRLVMRKPGSVLALPRDGGEQPVDPADIPYHYAAEVMDYARLMKGTEKYMMAEFEREIRELEFLEMEDGAEFGEDGEWSHKAIEQIFDLMEAYRGEIGNGPKKSSASDSRSRKQRRNSKLGRDDNEVYLRSSSSRMSSSDTNSRSRSRIAQGDSISSSSSDALYHFYKPRDASNCFLSPLDIRILKAAFGSFAAFPSTVLVRVEHIVMDQVVDDELKKRTKYLSYLPTGSPIHFLECDWTDIVRTEILKQFDEEIEQRRKMRHDKDAKEERAFQKARTAEENSLKSRPTVRRTADGEDEEFITLGDFGGEVEADDDYELSEALRRSTVDFESAFGSYASDDLHDQARLSDILLRDASGSPITDSPQWPSLSTPPQGYSMSSSPRTGGSSGSRNTTVWGTPVVQASRPDQQSEDHSGEWDGWADSSMFPLETSMTTESPNTTTSGRKQKKQKKKLVLMSTGGHWQA